MDDIRVWREKGVGFDFFQRQGYGFLAEGTPDLLQGEEFMARIIFDEIDI